MNTKKLFLPFVMAVLFVTAIIEVSFSQVNLKTVGLYEYAQFDGVWHTVVQGKQGALVDSKHLLVQLKDRTDIDRFDFSALLLPRLKNVRGEFADGFYELEIPNGLDGFEIARKLDGTGKFVEVLFNIFIKVDATPNDQHYVDQWNLPKVSMSSAWDIGTGNHTVVVAVIDVGADYDHEDLAGNCWSDIGYDFYDNNSDPYPSDDARHGTAVAGILGAVTNNSIGVAGVAGGWGGMGGIRIMHLDAGFRDENGEEWIGLSATAQAIDSAAGWGAKVINMSFSDPSGYSPWQSAINRAVSDYGVVCVASSGNYHPGYSTAIRYPAAYSNVIAVGATIPNDNRKEVNDGTEWWWGSCYGPELDVMAPGVYIWTTDLTGSIGYSTGNYYDSFNGTSAAAPHVAGLAALIRSVNPSLTWQQVRDIIRNTAEKVPGMGGQNFTNEYGYGRINAYQAVCQANMLTMVPTIVRLESAPAGVKIVANPLPCATSYAASYSSSSGGTIIENRALVTVPGYVSMAWQDITQPPPYPWVVNTNPYYWTILGQAGGMTGTPSASTGPVSALPFRTSTSANATANNNQRKIISTSTGVHISVYESNGDIFYINSTDAGATWSSEELVSQGDGRYSNPSVDWTYLMAPIPNPSEDITMIVWEENPAQGGGYRIWSRSRVNEEWRVPWIVHEDLLSRPIAATPVVFGLTVFWCGSNSLMWRGMEGSPPAANIPGTDGNSLYPAVDRGAGGYHLVWEQTGVGLRYQRGNVFYDGSAYWDSPITVVNNTALLQNRKPTVVIDSDHNACIAWEYKQTRTPIGNIKFTKIDFNGVMSPIVTFNNCSGTNNFPYSPSLSNHDNNFTLVWSTNSGAVGCVLFRNGNWSSPFTLSQNGQHASVIQKSYSSENPRIVLFTGKTGPPYQINIQTIPEILLPPQSPQLLYPVNGSVNVPHYTTLSWSCVFGANSYRIQIDNNNNFSSPEEDVSGLSYTYYTPSNLFIYTQYYWRVNTSNASGTSSWSDVWSFTTGEGQPPGGCPFVYTWNGCEFVEDNNILPQSEYVPKEDGFVTDHYQLFKTPAITENTYRLRVREFEQERSYLDKFSLIIIDHEPEASVSVSEDGAISQYAKPSVIANAQLDKDDVFKLVYELDGNYVQAERGTTLQLTFEGSQSKAGEGFKEETQAAALVGIIEPGEEKKVIAGSVNQNIDGKFINTHQFRLRRNPSFVWIPVENSGSIDGTVQVDINWQQNVRVDYTELSNQLDLPYTTYECELVYAEHSQSGDVTGLLLEDDNDIAVLNPGSYVDLVFDAPPIAEGKKRSFIFVSRGRYERISEKLSESVLIDKKAKNKSSEDNPSKPTRYELSQNHPNPFNPLTIINYQLPIDNYVTLKVYDVLGREVALLVDEFKEAGYYAATWDATNIPSGVYFYKLVVSSIEPLTAGSYTSVKKMILMR